MTLEAVLVAFGLGCMLAGLLVLALCWGDIQRSRDAAAFEAGKRRELEEALAARARQEEFRALGASSSPQRAQRERKAA